MIGSRKEVIKAPNDNIESVIETLETFIALKKKNQCKEIIRPQKNNLNKVFLEIINFLFNKGAKNSQDRVAINILYQTSFRESTDIKEPKIAVKPKIKTIK